MKFHHVHGKAIVLSDDRKQATRSEAHFCNGLVFGDQAIKVGQKLCVELTCVSSWSGALRIGVTTNDPNKLTQADLPKFAFPDLLKKEGYWGRSVNENLTASGTRVTFYVTTEGHLQVFINNEHKGVYLSRLPTNRTLWLFLDIYGNTKATKFVTPGRCWGLMSLLSLTILSKSTTHHCFINIPSSKHHWIITQYVGNLSK